MSERYKLCFWNECNCPGHELVEFKVEDLPVIGQVFKGILPNGKDAFVSSIRRITTKIEPLERHAVIVKKVEEETEKKIS